jgi:fibronectin-binding autotransporter adhesin
MSRTRFILAAAVAASLSGSVYAQSSYTGPNNGEWGEPANWNAGVPNAEGATANIDTAVTINLSDTGNGGAYPYTIGTLSTAIATGSVVIGNNTVTTDVLRLQVGPGGTPTINVANGPANVFYYANLEGTQGLNKTGNGRLTFRFNGADQTYSGPITISGGILGINQNGSLGNDDNDITIANGARLLAEPGSNSGTITLPASRAITLTGAQSQIGANAAAVNFVIEGTVTGDAASGLTKTDGGRVTLNGASSWGGDTRVVGGILDLNAGAGNFVQTGALLVQGGNGTSLDLRDLPSFTMNAPTRSFVVNPITTADTTGFSITSFLSSATNTITTSEFRIGGASGASQGASHTGALRLGTTNVVNAPVFTVGGFNGQGFIDFQPDLTNPSLKVRGLDGVAPLPTWTIGFTSSGTRTGGGTIDLTGGTLDAVVETLDIARHGANANNNITSRLIMPGGSLVATTVNLGTKTTEGGTPTVEAVLTQGGGTAQIRTLNMGTNPGGAALTVFRPSYNLNGGTLAAETIAAGPGGFGATSIRNLNLNGGTLENYDAATNLVVNGRDATTGGRINLVVGDNGGTIRADAGRSVTLGVNTDVSGTGTLTKAGPGALLVNGTASRPINVTAGSLGGVGTLTGAVTVTGATLAPGNGGVGTLTVNAPVSLDAASTLAVEIESASSFDKLVVGGAALTAAGKVVPTLVNGFVPAAADSFEIATAGSVAGAFDTSFGYARTADGKAGLQVQTTATSVVLSGYQLVGDVDVSGAVNNQDIAPFVALLTGGTPSGAVGFSADVDGNGVVNNQDIAPFVALLTGGRGLADVAGDPDFAPLVALVPEPGTLSLLAAAGVLALRRRRTA